MKRPIETQFPAPSAPSDVSGEQAKSRRALLKTLVGIGVGSAVFRRALAVQVAQKGKVTGEMIKQSEWIAGLQLSDEDRKEAASSMDSTLRTFRTLRQVPLENGVAPALFFDPSLGEIADSTSSQVDVKPIESKAPRRPDKNEDIAFMPVSELSALLRNRKISSVELTKIYLERLKKYDPALLCVVTMTEELALKQAKQADREIAAGRYRGTLHGIPWGAKDLIGYPGYPTTWGAPHNKKQMLADRATVARRLDDAGTVLLAKLSLGALAQGDKWFRGMTRSPWNLAQGSSGSSAGSSSATAAGLVGFSLGSETLGSIVSPSRRCGNSALRPTYGRVSRYGCMTLAWTMDKIGPICRSIEDCALVFGALLGRDGLDPTVVDRPFQWPLRRDLRSLTVGYFESRNQATKDREELKVLKSLGVKLVPVKLPDKLPVRPLTSILTVEAATVFDELTRKGITEGLNSWPRTFKRGQFIPAVEYLRANRVRTLLIQEMQKFFKQCDLYVGGNDLVLTNFTGHPTAVLPNGFRNRMGVSVPYAITFTGRLYGESELLAVAHAYQQATGQHLKRPPLDAQVKKK